MLELSELQSIHRGLKSKFDNLKPIFIDIRDFLNPYIGNFDTDNPSAGARYDQYFLKTTPLHYGQVFANGMQTGITDPTNKWFKLKFDDEDLMRDSGVRVWLSQVEDTIYSLLSKGHFYQENLQGNLELGYFGTSAMIITEDSKTGILCHSFTCGEYYLDENSDGYVDTFARSFLATARQVCQLFGEDKVPESIKKAKMDPSSVMKYKVYQLIIPNQDYDPDSWNNKHFPYSEYLWTDADSKLLRVSGYYEFPVIVSRWQRKPNTPYGMGAGFWSVRSGRELQLAQKSSTQMVELIANPPLQAPNDILNNGGVNMLPSHVNYYNPVGSSGGMITPILDGRNFQLEPVILHKQELEEEIKLHFHYDTFKLLSDMDKGTRTAREVIELSSEKKGQLGALLHRIETESLPAIIKRLLGIGFRNRLFPEPPETLQGRELSVEFDSILSQAQRQSDITPIIDTLTTAINISSTAQIPEILDSIDFDEAIDTIATLNGINPRIIKSKAEVQKIRQQRAMQQQMIMQQQMQQAQAEVAKTASQAKLDEPSALTEVLGGAVPNGIESY